MGFNATRLGVSALIIVSIIGILWYNFNSLNNEIYELNNTVKLRDKTIETKTTLIANRDITISTYESTLETITAEIDARNLLIEEQAKKLENSNLAYQELLNKPKEVRYKYIYEKVLTKDVDYNKATCEEGLELNRKISGVKYEDL